MKTSKLNWVWTGIIAAAVIDLTMFALGVAFLLHGYAAEEALPGVTFIAGGFIGFVLGVVAVYLAAVTHVIGAQEETDQANDFAAKLVKENSELTGCNADLRKALEAQSRAYDETVSGLIKQCEELEQEVNKGIKENGVTLGKLYNCEQVLVEVTRERDQLRTGMSRVQAKYDTLEAASLEYQALHGRKIAAYERQAQKHIEHLKAARATIKKLRAILVHYDLIEEMPDTTYEVLEEGHIEQSNTAMLIIPPLPRVNLEVA